MKRARYTLMIIVVSCLIILPFNVQAASFIRGDANGDGQVNMGDVTAIERMILGLDPPTLGADANGDGLVNMGDVTIVERIILSLATTTTQDSLDVYFIDVGQGDSILLDLGNTEVLIDGGMVSPGVVSFITPYVQGSLDVVVATHMDSDHIGGLTAVVNSFTISDIWTNGDDTSTSQTYTNFINAVNSNPAVKHVARRGDTIFAGPLTLTVQNPAGPLTFEVQNLVDTLGFSNNSSVVLHLDYGSVSFQFEGDAEQDAEQDAETSMLEAGVLHHSDILKVGHHGSRTASSTAFLAAVQPHVAVYMAETGNQYGHPHAETITALTNIGATIYGTDINGTITVSTDGMRYLVKKSKN